MDESAKSSTNEGIHRLFVGLPIPTPASSAIRKWAETIYEGQPVRLINENQMHSTLMFFPKVTDEKRNWMSTLIRQVHWDCLNASTGKTVRLGRGALAFELLLPESVTDELDDRLVRASIYGDFAYHDRLRTEPLGQLSLAQARPQWESRIRDHRHGRRLSLHVTFARFQDQKNDAIPLHQMQPFAIQLSQVALYESHLSPNGSYYEIISKTL